MNTNYAWLQNFPKKCLENKKIDFQNVVMVGYYGGGTLHFFNNSTLVTIKVKFKKFLLKMGSIETSTLSSWINDPVFLFLAKFVLLRGALK